MYLLPAKIRDPIWRQLIQSGLDRPAGHKIQSYICRRLEAGADILPPSDKVFSAFDLTPIETVRVVIVGQDPYHADGQAMGLSFSVPDGVRIPPSLRNILTEINRDVGATIITDGDLTPWTTQGVLLLNSILTVEKGKPGAHAKIGWEAITDQMIEYISSTREGVVFLLWGAFAASKQAFIDGEMHLVLTAPHPSPFSAYKGFFGCRHFSKTNAYLEANGGSAIQW